MKILIVDDEKLLVSSLYRGFAKLGYAIDTASDGINGQTEIELGKDEYDLVILDVGLPGKTGIEVCRDIRKQDITIPVIMLTARDAVSDRILGLDSGADDYIVKPFNFGELVARIRSLLRRPKSVCRISLTANGIELNPTSRIATASGREIRLTNKEFAILEYLMRNSGSVMSREQILTNIWDQSFDSFSNVVDVHIANLKTKINGKNHDSIIETVRGTGYRIRK